MLGHDTRRKERRMQVPSTCVKRTTIMLLVTLLALSVGCASKPFEPPAVWDGLEYRSGTASTVWYVRPRLEPRAWRTVMIDPPIVTIDERWDPIVNAIPVGQGIAPSHLSSRDVAEVKDVIGAATRRILAEELEAGGYRVVDQAQLDTIRLSPGLVDVYMDVPERGLAPRRSDDRMTLVMELSDATTTRVIARYVAREKGGFGMLHVPNTVVQDPDFRRAVRAWARAVRTSLDELSQAAAT
jgi:hypothetical protein